jgi:protein-S-isoprenylcysteine O-methyltransferase Ste14
MLIIAYIFYESLNFILIVFLAIWLLHYLNRSLIWPLRAKIKNKKMALIVAVLAFTFNTVNASIQALWIFKFTTYDNNWLYSFPFIAGLIIFFIGMYINIKSDNILFGLRREQDQGYHIPEGFLFNKVSNPNYFGEMIEWLGWAIMTWNLAGLIFFIWTVANLLPRAVANHNWYLDKFDNYPEERKILIPDFY